MQAEKVMAVNAVLCALAREKMPVPLAYKIQKWCRSVEGDVAFYTDKLSEIVKKYADDKKDASGGIRIKSDQVERCNAELKELREMEIDVPRISFTIDELSCLSMSPSDMAALDPFVEVEEHG